MYREIYERVDNVRDVNRFKKIYKIWRKPQMCCGFLCIFPCKTSLVRENLSYILNDAGKIIVAICEVRAFG